MIWSKTTFLRILLLQQHIFLQPPEYLSFSTVLRKTDVTVPITTDNINAAVDWRGACNNVSAACVYLGFANS